LLTGGGDKPYALGLAAALVAEGLFLDFIGSDDVNGPELHNIPLVNFLNLRGNQNSNASRWGKAFRVIRYYVKLIRYAATAKPEIFHILWNNKFELFDRTVLMLYYKLLGKKVVFTAHNVNAGKRDMNDSFANRLSLRIQYRLVDHIFVHTEKMKRELNADFGVPESKVTVIPFGINNTLPNSALTVAEAKRLLGVNSGQKTLLFFGNIAPYKGLDYLITALAQLIKQGGDYQLIIGGRPKGCEPYWKQLQAAMDKSGVRDRVIEKAEYIPDEEVELYCKAADVLVLPYTHVFQSGVLFLAYSFGLPVIAADVGSLREDVIEGRTGYLFRAKDSDDLVKTLKMYFSSALYKELENRRQGIRDYANERYSWAKVGEATRKVYEKLSMKCCCSTGRELAA
jgi:D-inositol-3-phosphate glycosyltransferase